MPKIEEYTAPKGGIKPTSTGFEALERGGRVIGQTYRQMQEDYRGIGQAYEAQAKTKGEEARSLEAMAGDQRKLAENAILGSKIQAGMIDEFKGIFEEAAAADRVRGGGGIRVNDKDQQHAYHTPSAAGQIAAGAARLTSGVAAQTGRGGKIIDDPYAWWDQTMTDRGYTKNDQGGWSYTGGGGNAPGQASNAQPGGGGPDLNQTYFGPPASAAPAAAGYPGFDTPSTQGTLDSINQFFGGVFGGGSSSPSIDTTANNAALGADAGGGEDFGSAGPANEPVPAGATPDATTGQ